MKPIISFLLGSGFSIPEGLPSVRQLNKRLSKIDESEIFVHTDQRAFFLNGMEDRNRFSRQDERLFLQEFLEFYNAKILNGEDEFSYESFYDFYSGYLHSNENQNIIVQFNDSFNKRNYRDRSNFKDAKTRVADFNRSFNQLLADQLRNNKYIENISHFNYPRYDDFIKFLRKIIDSHDVKVHTLNHDLFFDFIGSRTSDLSQYFSDGFELAGSPYYGILSHQFDLGASKPSIKKDYYVKLERFTGLFNKELCLFKLHGSIDNIIVNDPDLQQSSIRLKQNYAVSRVHKEIVEPLNGKFMFEDIWSEVSPDFLSGTTNKIRYYYSDVYYRNLFSHFEKNLSDSRVLFIIGYGFNDIGINEYLNRYLLEKEKRIVVIDPHKPNSDILDNHRVFFIEKSIIDVDYSEFFDLILNAC